MHSDYDHKKIEEKWQKHWEEENIYKTDEDNTQRMYILDMFPYPSGAGLHVGHPKGYIATDILSRFYRMNGNAVLHPMGWDSFGLPAENYAIKTQIHPSETTEKSIENFKSQIKGLSLSYDWGKEITTSSPEYCKWTQWLFLELYKKGLAYKKDANVNYCEDCKTVLANEQVMGDNSCERCKNQVIQKKMPQWFFKITEYADELIDGLDTVDWPDSTKALQTNWIGKSVGAELDFTLTPTNTKLTVFTTRPDTLYGATYVVIAPEHPLLEVLKEDITNWGHVENYIEEAKKKTELDRISAGKEKTGIKLLGVTAVNPINDEEVPVFVADYVLSSYGTGAIMAVPAHDERDKEFAEQFDLPIVEVVTEEGVLVNSGEHTGMKSVVAKQAITKSVNGTPKTTYRLRDWLVSRQRYWGAPIPIIYCDECGEVPVPTKDLPVKLPVDVDFMPTGESPLADSKEFHNIKCPSCGGDARRESDTMDTFVCSSWYYLRFADPQNNDVFAKEDAVSKWLPVDIYVGGAEHSVLHLLYARFITKALRDMGHLYFDEPFIKLRHQGLIIAEDGRKMSKSFGNVVNPDDIIERYGSDSLRLYEMFMGPFKDSISWSTENIIGVRRFIEKVWRMSDYVTDGYENDSQEQLLHQTIKTVTGHIADMKFNTAISNMMIFANKVESDMSITKESFMLFLQILSPFAPHVTEELWHKHGNTGSIHKEKWPLFDEEKARPNSVTIGIQINGKVRDEIELSPDASEDEVRALVMARKKVGEWMEGQTEKRFVYVPGKIINIVVG